MVNKTCSQCLSNTDDIEKVRDIVFRILENENLATGESDYFEGILNCCNYLAGTSVNLKAPITNLSDTHRQNMYDKTTIQDLFPGYLDEAGYLDEGKNIV